MNLKKLLLLASKVLLVFTIIGFFMPISCSMSGPELLGDGDYFLFGVGLLVAVILSIACIVMIKKEKGDNLPIAVFAVVFLTYLAGKIYLSAEYNWRLSLDSGGNMMLVSSIFSALLCIAAKYLERFNIFIDFKELISKTKSDSDGSGASAQNKQERSEENNQAKTPTEEKDEKDC